MHSLLLLHHSFPSPLLPRRLSSRHLKSFFISEIARAPPNPELRYRRLIVTTQCADDEKVQTTDDEYPVGFPSYKKDILQNWPTIGGTLLGLGFLLGPILDGIHSNVELQTYGNGAINIGPLKTDVVVPPLLAVFYSVVGLLQLALDKWIAPKNWKSKSNFRRVLFSLILLVIILEASAEMYKAGTPYNIEAYILFALAEINWVLCDGTWWGFGLAAAVGVICPLSEIPLMRHFDLWHYTKPNIEIMGEGLVTWVLACYFSYVPFIANLARWLSSQNAMAEKVGVEPKGP